MSTITTETLGWLAAVGAMLSFGSFGVPIKSDRSNAVDIDPLVFQSYKSGMCFLTAWLVLLAGVPFSFTPWGIVSCMFWVPGGVATVFAIRNAGLAIAIGIGSSSIVLVSFVWGIFVFQEPIHSKVMACLAVAMMMTGILGMSYYSAPPTTTTAIIAEIEDDGNSRQEFLRMNPTNSSLEGKSNHIMVSNHYQRDHRGKYYQGIHEIQQPMSTTNDTTLPIQQFSEEKGDLIMTKQKQRPNDVILATARTSAITDSISESDNTENDSDNNNHNNDDNHSDLFIDEPTQDLVAATSIQLNHQQQQLPTTPTTNGPKNPSEVLHLGYGISCTRRQLGIAGAVFNGVWGGSILAPMRWCKDNTSGVGYLISFGIGAAVVTTTLWILRLLFNTIYYYHGNPVVAYQALPSFHLPVMWLPGGTSGLLWSIGNFFSLISVFYLGEGVGYSVVQAGMLVSGLWGIFYFHEISGIETIAKWIASACITVCGIILLSYEHHKK